MTRGRVGCLGGRNEISDCYGKESMQALFTGTHEKKPEMLPTGGHRAPGEVVCKLQDLHLDLEDE